MSNITQKQQQQQQLITFTMVIIYNMPQPGPANALFNAIHTYAINVPFFVSTFNFLNAEEVAQLAPDHQALYQHHLDELQSGAYATVEYCNIKLLVHGSLYELPFFSAVSEIFSIDLNAIRCAFKLKCFNYENIISIEERKKIWPKIYVTLLNGSKHLFCSILLFAMNKFGFYCANPNYYGYKWKVSFGIVDNGFVRIGTDSVSNIEYADLEEISIVSCTAPPNCVTYELKADGNLFTMNKYVF